MPRWPASPGTTSTRVPVWCEPIGTTAITPARRTGIALAEGTSTAITGRASGLTVDGGGGAVQSDAFDCTANLLP